MDMIMLGLMIIAGLHAFTYSRWLIQHGNKAGGTGIYIIILAGLALPLYRMLTAL